MDLQLVTFKDFGKNFVKTLKLSPDGFIQNAIQLAYYKYVYTLSKKCWVKLTFADCMGSPQQRMRVGAPGGSD